MTKLSNKVIHSFLKNIALNMPPQEKQKLEESKSNMLVWTDDEVQGLLKTVKEFKSKKLYNEGIDWESLKDKHI